MKNFVYTEDFLSSRVDEKLIPLIWLSLIRWMKVDVLHLLIEFSALSIGSKMAYYPEYLYNNYSLLPEANFAPATKQQSGRNIG